MSIQYAEISVACWKSLPHLLIGCYCTTNPLIFQMLKWRYWKYFCCRSIPSFFRKIATVVSRAAAIGRLPHCRQRETERVVLALEEQVHSALPSPALPCPALFNVSFRRFHSSLAVGSLVCVFGDIGILNRLYLVIGWEWVFRSPGNTGTDKSNI